MSHSLLPPSKQAIAAIALAIFIPAIAGCSGASPMTPQLTMLPGAGAPFSGMGDAGAAYTFKTLDNSDDPTFNELLGINNLGKIGGYYGSGKKSDPSVGYIIRKFGNSHYRTVLYPGATNTRVTCVNNLNVIAGDYDAHGGTFGFIEAADGIWTSFKDPHTRGATNVTVILGLSDSGLAVGYWLDANGVKHAFELTPSTGLFRAVSPPGAVDSVAAGINGKGDIVGYFTKHDKSTESFLLKGGVYTLFSYKESAQMTEALSINWQDEIAGMYTDHSGKVHGFVLDDLLKGPPVWQAPISDPSAKGKTVVTGIQNHHALVGYYVDGAGHTNGFLAMPSAR